MTKTISIIQSNYIPWKGYFDLIGLADEFIVLDTVQFTKNDWRNRNKIKTAAGPTWLTIPVKTGGKFGQSIAETEIADMSWAERHWAKIAAVYGKQAGFSLYGPRFERLYAEAAEALLLSQVNTMFIREICDILQIQTSITSAADYPAADGKNERVIGLCKAAGGARYLSGPAAAGYIDGAQFAANGIDLAFIDYGGYPQYDQLYPPFEHGVSILDLLLTTGEAARRFMKFAAADESPPCTK
jgi:hypothetical protein